MTWYPDRIRNWIRTGPDWTRLGSSQVGPGRASVGFHNRLESESDGRDLSHHGHEALQMCLYLHAIFCSAMLQDVSIACVLSDFVTNKERIFLLVV